MLPLLAGFFVMGFGDIIGTVMNQVKAECASTADSISWLMPIFAYVWFLVVSIPTGVLSGRIGRKNAVLVSLAVTVAAMIVPIFANAERWYLYVVAFAFVGIGNTIIQAALPALMSNVVEPSQLASRISLGQFVKAVCAALTPVFVYLTATAFGNWKLLFPLYGALTVAAAIWLWLTKIPDERHQNHQTTQPPRMAILREQGVNGHIEMAAAFALAGFDCQDVHMSDLIEGRVDLADFKGLVACGGFSYGDVLGAGSGWARSILYNDRLREMFRTFFHRPDTFSLGVCNGCQMLSQLKDLIPGAEGWPKFVKNVSEQFEARLATIEIEDSPSIFFKGMAGSRLPIPVAHGEGRVWTDGFVPSICAAHFVDGRGQATTR